MDSNDIELFSTTDLQAKNKVVSALVMHRVSYLERWKKISIFRRREFGGAKELCVIYVNGNQYKKAKKILDEFNEAYISERKEKRRRKKAQAEAEARMAAEENNAADAYGEDEEYEDDDFMTGDDEDRIDDI